MPLLPSPSKFFIALAILFSGICWYLGFGLTGNFWYLIWVAPIPVLYVCFQVSGKQAFAIAFIAYLIGRLSWLPYLLSVAPAPLAIMFTILLPLAFAVLVIGARRVLLVSPHWLAAFAFPVLFTAFEYVMFLLSKDGTMASIAYTQCRFLPVVQVASVTGIEGITFLITFIPSVIAVMVMRYKAKKSVTALTWLTAGIFCIALLFGSVRLADDPADKQVTVPVGMAVINEKIYDSTFSTGTLKQLYIAGLYLNEVSVLATQGAQVIVLPEKVFRVSDSTSPVILKLFEDTAIARHVSIVIGVTKIKQGYLENNAWVISDEGKLLADYEKVHLFEGEIYDTFRTGKDLGLFSRNGSDEGVAICKDFDFQQYILGFGKAKRALVYAPAWDFVRDGWLHSRMAMMRSVEGGYSLVRNAREGRLTINDYRGKLLFEASCESRTQTELLGKVPLENHATIYSSLGDWFGILNLIATAWFIFSMTAKKKAVPSN